MTNKIETTPAPAGLSAGMTGYRWTTAHGDTVEVWQAAPLGRPLDWRWHVQGRGNHEVLEQGEGYTRRGNARDAAARHHPPTGDPSPYLVEKLTDLLQQDVVVDLQPAAIDAVAVRWAAELAQEIPGPINPDRSSVEIPRAWLAFAGTIPRPGERVLLDGVPHRVDGLDTDPDRAVVHLVRVTHTTD